VTRQAQGLTHPIAPPPGVSGQRGLSSVALLSPCGHGNLGDAAIQDAVIANLIRRHPTVQIYGITLHPDDTVRRHGVPAVPIGAVPRPDYTVMQPVADPTAEGGGRRQQGSLSTEPWTIRAVRRVARAVLPAGAPWMIRVEVQHWRMAFRFLRDVETVVVSGGGQLDDYWGGAWGHPYALFKWALLTRLRGRRFVVLSTGTGSLDSLLSRFFVRFALRRAAYRSYRDAGSRALIDAIGFVRSDLIVPDLAYSLPLPAVGRGPANGGLVTIVVCPMAYCDPRSWPRKDVDVFRRYTDTLAACCEDLLQSGRGVVLATSDGPDGRVAAELAERIRLRREGLADRLRLEETNTVERFLRVTSEADIVVASRLHGVILSHLVGKPVVALSYDRKVDALMEEAGQAHNKLDIETFRADDLKTIVCSLEANLGREREVVRRHVSACADLVNSQYVSVFPAPHSA
jgi:polysaccharide pyruvyl transferase WcaK-like protein